MSKWFKKELGSKNIELRNGSKLSVALNGLKIIFKNENSFRFQLLGLSLVIILGLYFKISAAQWMAIVVVSGFVLICEALNTAIENTLDLIDQNYNPQIGQIKDICAGAVLISALSAMIVGGIIFIPQILSLF
ncbi:MAG: diacylglycerol kinase family protein [Bacilli bacterium]